MKKIFYFVIWINLLPLISMAQTQTVTLTFEWEAEPKLIEIFGNTTIYQWTFDGAGVNPNWPEFPVKSGSIDLAQQSIAELKLENVFASEIDLSQSKYKDSLSNNVELWHQIINDRNRYKLQWGMTPIYKQGSRYYKVDSAELIISLRPDRRLTSRGSDFKDNSVLRTGKFYKFAVYQTGVYRLSYNDMASAGFDVDNINPGRIKVYTNGGGILPASNSAERIDDLEEIAITVVGGDDGSFDQGDYILFFTYGPEKWMINEEARSITLPKNFYSKANHVFVTADGLSGKRVNVMQNGSPASYTTSEFDDYIRYEEDRININNVSNFTSGGGQNWYGDYFRNLRERSYPNIFKFPGLNTSVPVQVRSEFVGRCADLSRYEVIVDGQTLNSSQIGRTTLSNAETAYATPGFINGEVSIMSEEPTVTVRYPDVSGNLCEGWLDYIEMRARRQIRLTGSNLIFRDFESIGESGVTYRIQGNLSNCRIWDITDELVSVERGFDQADGNIYEMHVNNVSGLRQYIIFRDNSNLPRPEFIKEIENQNIHGLTRADLVIVYHERFKDEASRLADFRRNFSGLQVETVDVDKIYNEFSGGSVDASGIRDFARMLYERDADFKYLLLFGDASYDYRGILLQEDRIENFVSTWQTPNSLHPINTFPSDDYFALLDPNEGGDLRGGIDIAVGRLPANTVQEARAMVDKIIRYEEEPQTFGDWRLRHMFMADDGDGNRHVIDADLVARGAAELYPEANQNKVYFDAFPRIITPGGARFPAAKESMNRGFEQGQLIYNYLGHGGPSGLGDERVMTLEDISSWTNRNNLTMFITATCTFAPFDNPARQSAGELAMVSDAGGAIGLLTTTRAVFASSNRRLTQSVFNFIFERENGEPIPIGEVLRRGKNFTSSDTLQNNARKFMLIGDPTTKLALPKYNVTTLSINGKEVDPASPDTLMATGKYTITGAITGFDGEILTDFNGTVNPTIFDKKVTLSTLGQSSGSNPFEFQLQRNIVFRGAATVENGMFSFTFIMPKDINYTIGNGKISYYAHDGMLKDAAGYDNGILIGGTASGSEISDRPPELELFMNSEDFAFGGMTDNNPVLLVKLQADNGINFTGNSVGRDMVAILDDDEASPFILNDFYESELDDFTKGTVRFPFRDLEPGLHNVRVKAFDVVNNSAEGYLEFVVVNNENFTIKNLYNYPNPFNRHTSIQFEHNNVSVPMDIQVMIYTVSGKLVKSIERRIVPNDYLIRDIKWDALDEYGQRLANGVYLYKVKVSLETPDGSRDSKESDFQKMVILN